MAPTDQSIAFGRRQLLQLAATGAALGGGMKLANAAPSEVAAGTAPQPAPNFANDPNTSDIIVETLIQMGRDTRLRRGRRWHQSADRGVAPTTRQNRLYPHAPRGSRGFHGLPLRQAHRPPRGLRRRHRPGRDPNYGCQLPPIDFVAFAKACGADGFHCERPEDVRPAIQATLASPKAALVEAVGDPEEKPAKPDELRA